VTFDFWNTLMWETPGSLKEHRLATWAETLPAAGVTVDPDGLVAAHDAAHAAYEAAWQEGRQFTVDHAVSVVLDRLGLEADEGVVSVLLNGFDEGGRRAAIAPSDGVHDCLRALKADGLRLGILCDIGLTPSYVVRELLAAEDLLDLFDGTTFSDEAGHYKPAREAFEAALADIGGVAPEEAVHVGDRLRTDVGGAAAMGMTSVRYRGVYDDPMSELPEADLVIDSLAELPSRLGASALR
jgi:putative hydrolase of the HAD superfamily